MPSHQKNKSPYSPSPVVVPLRTISTDDTHQTDEEEDHYFTHLNKKPAVGRPPSPSNLTILDDLRQHPHMDDDLTAGFILNDITRSTSSSNLVCAGDNSKILKDLASAEGRYSSTSTNVQCGCWPFSRR